MRRATLESLRCPRCLGGSLVPEADVAEPRLIFGPVRCLGCSARFPVGEGLIDFVGERAAPTGFQKSMETTVVARGYERYVRPAVELLLTQGRFDRDSEYLVYRSLIGRPNGPIVEVGCGTGLFSRRLAAEPDAPRVVAVDVSKPMIEEAIAQAREASVSLDFVRAEVPPLPFLDATIGAVLQAGVVHFIADLPALLREVARVLKPQGRYVASTWQPPAFTRPAHRAMGLYPRGEGELKRACEDAGLVRFERLRAPPVMVFKAERP